MKILLIISMALSALLSAGCRSGKTEKQKDEFFTSGSREADQRASQRMARDQQLSGADKDVQKAKPNAGGTGWQAAQAEGKLTLYERLGGESGITAMVDDFTQRALEDPRVNWQRKGVKRGGLFGRKEETAAWTANEQNLATLKKHLVQF